MRLKLTWNGQFNLIHNFFHLCHQSISFLEKSQKFSFLGGGTLAYFLSFSLFQIVSHNLAENDPQWQILPKSGSDCVKMANLACFLSFTPNNSELSISPDSQLFPSFATKASHFWRNLKNFHFWGGGYIGKFFRVFQIFKSFHTNAAENDPQWQIWPKKWLRLYQKGQFGMFF